METEAQTEASQHPNGLGNACPQPPSEQDWVLLNCGGPEQTYALQHQRTMPSLPLRWTRLPGGVLWVTRTKQLAKFATRMTQIECSTKHKEKNGIFGNIFYTFLQMLKEQACIAE